MKKSITLSLIVAILAGVGLTVFRVSIPRTAEGLFLRAQGQEEKLKKREKSLPADEKPKKWMKVIRSYEKVETSYPESEFSPGALKRISELYSERLKDHENAVLALEKLLEKYSGSELCDDVLFSLGQIYQNHIRKAPHFIQAIEAYRKLINNFPESEFTEKAMYESGNIYYNIKEYELALHTYEEFVEIYPESQFADDAQYKIASIYGEQLEKNRKAKEAYEKLEKDYPHSVYSGAAKALKEKHGEMETREEEETHFSGYYKLRISDPFEEAWDRLRQKFEEIETQKLDIFNYDMDIEISPENRLLKARVKMDFRCGRKGLSKLLFLLNRNMVLSSVRKGTLEPNFRQSEDTVRIDFGEKLQKDVNYNLEFSYQGEIGDENKNKTGCFIAEELWYPMGWLGDLFTASVRCKAPAELTAICPGVLEEAKKDKNSSLYIWQIDLPIFGLYLAYGAYEKISSQHKDILISLFSDEESLTEDKASKFLREVAEILDFYSLKFGSYPFKKLAIAGVPIAAARGSPSLLLLPQEIFQLKEIPVSLLAHEIAHQWWGNLVPISFLEGALPWLSEGFATYSDALYIEKRFGIEKMKKHLEKMGRMYFQRVIYSPDEAVVACWSYSPVYRAVVYEKGALILHALRFVVGDEHFFKMMRTYAERFSFIPVTLSDFQSICEEVYGDNLGWFFDQWLRKDGFPHYAFGDVKLRHDGERYTVSAEILQKERIFTMPVEITLRTEKREITRRYPVDKKTNLITMETDEKPLSLQIDKDNWVLKHPDPEELIKKIATNPDS